MKLRRVTTKTSATVMAVVGALSFAASGCGGSGRGTCGIAPCGGDVVGNWTGSSVCFDRATLSMDILTAVKRTGTCPEVSLGAASLTPTGALALAADMTFTGDLAVNAIVDIDYPAACLGGATCDTLAETLQTTVGTNGVTAISCVGIGSCTCTTLQTIDIVNATGTWATSGTQLTFAGAPG